MDSNIKFSVLFPTKNRLELLKHGINSVLVQDYQNFEIIISDNCSECDIKGYVESLNDNRIKYVRQNTPLSVCENWNAVNDLATGDYIIMLGDDDALMPGYFNKCLSVIEQHPDLDLIHHGVYYYLMPDVYKYMPDGYVRSSLTSHGITNRPTTEPYVLSKEQREIEVKSTFKSKYTFGFNAQFFLYSKELVRKMEKYGKFYQPPYPDTYAANMMMLVAKKVIVVPEELVILGITPKSYGSYLLNNKDKEGMEFHKDADFREYAPKSIRNKLLRIPETETAAFATVALIPEKFPKRKDFKLSLDGYYKLAIKSTLYRHDKKTATELVTKEILPRMDFFRRIAYSFYVRKHLKKVGVPQPVSNKAERFENVTLLLERMKRKQEKSRPKKCINDNPKSLEEALDIVIPTYNRMNTLQSTIEKLLNSPVKNCRITILDNNSKDDTQEYCQELMKKHSNIVYLKNQYNIGMGGNFCKALTLPEKKYFWIVFDDAGLDFTHWSEVEEGMRLNKDVITTLNYYKVKNPDKEKAELILMLNTLFDGIFKTSLITEDAITYAIADIYTAHPQLSVVANIMSKNPSVHIPEHAITFHQVNPEGQGSDYTFNRAGRGFHHFRMDEPCLFLHGFLMAIQSIKDKKLKERCIELLFIRHNGIGPYFKFGKRFFKKYKYHILNWVDVATLLPWKYRLNFIFRSILYQLIKL